MSSCVSSFVSFGMCFNVYRRSPAPFRGLPIAGIPRAQLVRPSYFSGLKLFLMYRAVSELSSGVLSIVLSFFSLALVPLSSQEKLLIPNNASYNVHRATSQPK
jgi:hypothetical protein